MTGSRRITHGILGVKGYTNKWERRKVGDMKGKDFTIGHKSNVLQKKKKNVILAIRIAMQFEIFHQSYFVFSINKCVLQKFRFLYFDKYNVFICSITASC